MNVLIDTNLAIDVLTQREPYFEDSQLILHASEMKHINGYVSASAITDIYYIINRLIKNKEKTKALIKKLVFDAVEVAMVDGSIIAQALNADWDDFEDCVQYYVGDNISVDYIVTRNPGDYANGNIAVILPEDLLDLIAPDK
jgi:predicted nucleic acid-binding protein